MWLIPGKTKVRLEIFKGVGLADVLVGLVGALIETFLLMSNIPHRFIIAAVILGFVAVLLIRVDAEPNYRLALMLIRYFGISNRYGKIKKHGTHPIEDIMPFTGIENDLISYNGQYYGAVLEIPAVEFRLFSDTRKNNTIINGFGRVLRAINPDWSMNIVKVERPVHYESFRTAEENKLEELRKSYESGMLSEDEFKIRTEIIFERIDELDGLMDENTVIIPFYYLVLFDSDKRRLENQTAQAMSDLREYEIKPKRVRGKDIAVFLKYTNSFDVDEHEADDLEGDELIRWAMPEEVKMNVRTTEVSGIVSHTLRVGTYPSTVSNAWLASVMTAPGTKVVVKCSPMDTYKSIRNIDRSINELRGQAAETGVESRRMEIEEHIQSLTELLSTLQGDNEILLQTNIYVTAYDIAATEANPRLTAPESSGLPHITNMKRSLKRTWAEHRLRLVGHDLQQLTAFTASQVSNLDPYVKEARGIPTNSLAASYPWVFANVADEGGDKLGSSEQVPVFIDFFRRDSERVNSNMMIVGKSGSGKSYATKSILTNLVADNCKVFILDPENEYEELASNLHGKYINVGNAQYGRLNPFHVFTALDDEDSEGASGSYAMHLQFLEEFFRQILPDCDKDALEYLNSIIDRMYMERGITAETDLSKLKPSDYPVFDELYDAILQEFQKTDSEYIRVMLRTLMNYISKFSAGGRNANIWNGPSTIRTDENFTVFNFQSLLANRNGTVANAQMLLVLKYIDNEIIKNREYNRRYHTNRRVVVVIDEAHVFIDTKFPVALDFMTKLAKQIRKYNGMQIVITQNIKDFVGNEEIARKSTAIINACQYSFIFSLAPNDLADLCTLYEKSGGINETELEQISTAPRGQAFTVLSPMMRTTFRVETLPSFADIFENPDRELLYFGGEEGQAEWESFLGDSRALHDANSTKDDEEEIYDAGEEETEHRSYVSFERVSEEEYEAENADSDDEFEGISDADEDISQNSVHFEKVKAASTEYDTDESAESSSSGSGNTRTGSEDSGMIEKLLTSLSYENLEMKVGRMLDRRVEEEVNRRLGDRLTESDVKPADNTGSRRTVPEEDDLFGSDDFETSEDSGSDFSLDDLFDDMDVDDSDRDDDTGSESDDTDDIFDDDDIDIDDMDDEYFDDIFSDLTTEPVIPDNTDVAEVEKEMEESGENVREITLAELRSFVSRRKNGGIL